MPSHPCPICRKKIEYARATDLATFPFCSERCRLVDLGRWLDEGYVISQPISPADLLSGAEEEDSEADEKPPGSGEAGAGD